MLLVALIFCHLILIGVGFTDKNVSSAGKKLSDYEGDYFSVIKKQKVTKVFSDATIPDNKRSCLKLADKFVKFIPNEGSCEKWNCRGSQVTLVNKYRIRIIYNNFRKSASLGNCKIFGRNKTISNMVEMSWHWTLEEEARRIAANCPNKMFSTDKRRVNITGLDSDVQCEIAATSVEFSEESSQHVLLTKLRNLLELNEMNDFENGRYRRGNTNYFGCTIVLRIRDSIVVGSKKSSGEKRPIGHLVCVFCTKENNVTSTFGSPGSNCPNGTKPDREMCIPEMSSSSVFACQPEIDRVCPHSTAVDDWTSELAGSVEEVFFIPTGGGEGYLKPFIRKTIVEQELTNSIDKNYGSNNNNNSTYIYKSLVRSDVTLADLPFPVNGRQVPPREKISYDENYLNALNETTNGTTEQYEDASVQYDDDGGPYDVPGELFQGAHCCSWFFIVSLLLLVLTISLSIAIFMRQRRYTKTR